MHRLTTLVSLAVLAGAPLAHAQQTPLRIERFDGRSSVEFLAITGFRALSDGRVLVADAPGEQLTALDARGALLHVIGRIGSGPREYRSVDRLFGLARDSTILPDLGNGRWHLLVGAELVATWTVETPLVDRVRATLLGVDTVGGLVSRRRLRGYHAASKGFRAESAAVIRVDRRSLREDTLTLVRGRPVPGDAAAAGTPRNPLFAQAFGIPMLSSEQAIVFPDGWVAVARLDPYRVDWHPPEGEVRLGRPIPYNPVEVTPAERRAHERLLGRSLGRSVRSSPSQVWPREADAFGENALVAGPDGSLWVRLQSPAEQRISVYQIIDRRGTLVGEVHLNAETYVLGFAHGRLFASEVDEDGFHHLVWVTWPSRIP